MSTRRPTFNALVEDLLSELESELESESPESEDSVSCSGWESDPQSFSIRAAQNFCQDAFNVAVSTPDKVNCTGQSCVVRYVAPSGWPVFNITVDLSGIPGSVTVSGTADPFRMRPKTCSYRYACSATGSISFTRIRCQ